ncbi:hypothetical protein FHS31_000876 [Sphingomonas vulcanisoli]|uniref:Uncharacterized protein n=1 Tax=Sphingomonas vulcanisoli TaxID=1658060 RepID=A0ABX0TRW9_9SPHN|nr:hypothetical protein [Sphingomonas vulcanisoli]NIJ07280.1 hypothetical protein [Sphingomonas vulcanisoli]
MSRKPLLMAMLSIAIAVPAVAVGLGPLKLDGLIDGPREGFALDLYNPYPEAETFMVYPVGLDDEVAQDRVTVLPAEVELGSARSRRVLVIADNLAVGETYHFRVCAQRKTPPEGITLNARVCSKISAHRVG